MSDTPIFQWAVFAIVVAVALALDLLVFHRKKHAAGFKEAAIESAGWIGLSLAFNAWVYYARGPEAGLQFLTAYLVEKSLSMDNLFVFILIFSALGVPGRPQHKVLFYGVAGALALRGVFVWAGVELLREFHAMMYVFAAILLFTGTRMLLTRKKRVQPGQNWAVRLARFVLPISDRYEDDKFLVKENGQRKFTTLLVALLAVEAMDVLFAVDSVPAVLAITREPLIAYASNAFAILGLRSLYFVLSAALSRLRYLHEGLAIILVFVAVKMIAGDRLHLSTGVSLGIVAAILALTVLASTVSWGGRKTRG
jgi:tellurite resistance protein TerC